MSRSSANPAGAMSIGALLAAPKARGLFTRRSCNRGRRISDANATRPRRSRACWSTGWAATRFRRPRMRSSRRRARTSTCPAIPAVCLSRRRSMQTSCRPRAIEQLRAGSAGGIPILAGTTMEEWKLFTAARPKLRLMDCAKLRRYTANLVGEDHADALLAVYARRLRVRALERGDDRSFLRGPRRTAFGSTERIRAVLRLSLDWRSPCSRASWVHATRWNSASSSAPQRKARRLRSSARVRPPTRSAPR